MKIQQFTGGQASRLRPQYIGQNEAVRYVNIDNSVGTLAPVNDKLDAELTLEPYHEFFHAEQVWVESVTETEFLEYQQTMYLVDGVQPKKFKNGEYHNLGIVAPTTAPTLEITTSTGESIKSVTDMTVNNFASTEGTYGDLPISPFRYLVFASNGLYSNPLLLITEASTNADMSTASRAVSRTYFELPVDSGAIVELPDEYDRSIEFSEFKLQDGSYAVVYRYFTDDWYEVGTTQSSATILDSVEDISGNRKLIADYIGTHTGTYQYVYTFYNAAAGIESAPSPVSEELTVEAGRIGLTGLETSSDPQVTDLRIYRVGGNITQFSLVAEVPNGTLLWNDTIADEDIDGRQLETDNYYAAPTDLRYLAESYAMLFGAVGDTLRFTPIGNPDAWPPEFSIAFDAEITGIGAVANGVIVCTQFKSYLVTGTGPFSLAQQSLSGDQGCISHASIQEIGTGIIWASAEGLCMSSGNGVTNITKPKLGKLTLDPVDSALDDEVYYCHNSDGSTLAWDFRFGNIPKYFDLGVERMAVANSELYGWSEGAMYKLFQGEDKLPMTYLSPRFIEGTTTESKTYKKFHIYAKGDIIINILINDVVVLTKTLAGEKDYQLQVPQQLQRGNFIQVEITGTGEVYEYEYIAGKTKNA